MQANEERLTLVEAAKCVPGRPHASALWRHCRKGLRARNGQLMFLRHERWGGKIFVTERWLLEFAEQLAEADREYFRTTSQCDVEVVKTELSNGRIP